MVVLRRVLRGRVLSAVRRHVPLDPPRRAHARPRLQARASRGEDGGGGPGGAGRGEVDAGAELALLQRRDRELLPSRGVSAGAAVLRGGAEAGRVPAVPRGHDGGGDPRDVAGVRGGAPRAARAPRVGRFPGGGFGRFLGGGFGRFPGGAVGSRRGIERRERLWTNEAKLPQMRRAVRQVFWNWYYNRPFCPKFDPKANAICRNRGEVRNRHVRGGRTGRGRGAAAAGNDVRSEALRGEGSAGDADRDENGAERESDEDIEEVLGGGDLSHAAVSSGGRRGGRTGWMVESERGDPGEGCPGLGEESEVAEFESSMGCLLHTDYRKKKGMREQGHRPHDCPSPSLLYPSFSVPTYLSIYLPTDSPNLASLPR